MKSSKYFILLALLGVAFSFWQCGGDSAAPVDPQDAKLTELSKTWKVSTSPSPTSPVTFNSTPVTGYENLQIVMSGTPGQDTFTYTITGRPSGVLTPWNASGTFTFGTNFSSVLTRDDGTVVTYSVSGTQLQMTFTYAGAGYTGTRVTNVNGTWSFSFGL